jgi:hypothetical protein
MVARLSVLYTLALKLNGGPRGYVTDAKGSLSVYFVLGELSRLTVTTSDELPFAPPTVPQTRVTKTI